MTHAGPLQWATAALLTSAVFSAMKPASACGGLFCSTNAPVNQAAERIIFAQDDSGNTAAVIEIQYEGPSESFAWVLPVPGVPEVGLSSKQALDFLQGQTNPQYLLNRTFEDSCRIPVFAPGPGGAQDGGGVDSEQPPPVVVLASGTVGPYDFNVIQIDPQAPEPVQLMLDWLTMNDYDVSLLGEDLLGAYVAEGMNFLAVRLNKSANAGSIRPVLLRYQSEQPVIPIRPTAVAANPDMGVLVWVLGSARAIPTNYLGLEINDALLNWFNPSSNYNDVVIEAADEAGGHGFVTEHADLASTMESVIWFGESWRNSLDDAEVFDLMESSALYFGSWDGYADVVTESVPLRAGVTVDEFLECVTCYFYPNGRFSPDGGELMGIDSSDPIFTLDTTVFLADLDRLVIDPMRETQALFDDAEYTTRLYTTLSADEMTVDPAFDFNPDLDLVSNIHQADQLIQCVDGGQSWAMTLPSGLVVYGIDNNWPIDIDSGLPFNLRILQYSTSGPGEVIVDNLNPIDDMLPPGPMMGMGEPGTGGSSSDGGLGSGMDDEDAGVPDVRTDPSTASSDCGCRVVGRSQPKPVGAALGLGLLGLLLLRRRAN